MADESSDAQDPGDSVIASGGAFNRDRAPPREAEVGEREDVTSLELRGSEMLSGA